jgi:uncharacterized protein
MNLDLSNLTDTGSHMVIKREVKLQNFSFRHQEIETPFPFQLDLDIYSTKDSFVLSGYLRGKLVLICSRCLEKFNYPVNIELQEEYLKKEISDLEYFDLTDIFQENLLLTLPIKPICSKECKGLCPICGQNLNEGECNCKQEFIDPRMAKLKDYFAEDN